MDLDNHRQVVVKSLHYHKEMAPFLLVSSFHFSGMSPDYIWTVSPGWLAHAGEYQDPGVDFPTEDSGRTSTHTFRLKYALDM